MPLSMSIALFVPLQLTLSPIRVLAIRVGHALDVAVAALSNPIRACITGPRPSAAMELAVLWRPRAVGIEKSRN